MVAHSISTRLMAVYPPMSLRICCPYFPSFNLSMRWRPEMLLFWVDARMEKIHPASPCFVFYQDIRCECSSRIRICTIYAARDCFWPHKGVSFIILFMSKSICLRASTNIMRSRRQHKAINDCCLRSGFSCRVV